MKRRALLRKSGVAALAAGALAGCTGTGSSPPPRRSNVIEDVTLRDGALQATLADDPWVTTRREDVPANRPEASSTTENASDSAASLAGGVRSLLGALSPVGGARAAKGRGGSGRGATGRGGSGYSNAPKTGKGRAKYHGGHYVGVWYHDHDDDVTRAETVIGEVAVARVGRPYADEERLPDPGPVPWDRTWQDPDGEVDITVTEPGWYRVGTHLETPGGADLGWECVDVLVEDGGDGLAVDERWKVSPRI